MKKLRIILMLSFGLICSANFAQINDQLKIDKLEINSDKTNGFDNLNWKSDYKTTEIGKPELPIHRVSYVLPIDAVVAGVTFKKKNKQKLDGSFYLYPAQEPIPTDNSKEVKFTVPDSKVYESNQPYPNKLYEIESDRFLQGYHIVTLLIYPFEYIPKSRTLNYYSDLDYSIQYTLGGNADEIRPLTQTVLRAEQCKDFVKSLVQNTEDVDVFGSNALSIREGKKTVQKSSGIQKSKALSVYDEIVPNYIIITCDSLKSTFQTLADWKSKKGVFTIIITTEEIANNYSGIDLAEKIRKYIIEAYSKWGAGLYILLGGDTNIVPARMVQGDKTILRPSDRYFTSYKGTWNSNGDNVYLGTGDAMTTDIGVILGRAPVENVSEATIFRNKIISYEKATNISNSKLNYFNNYLFLDEYLDWSNGKLAYDSHRAIQTNNNAYLPSNIIRKYIYDNKDCSNTTPYSSSNCATGDMELNKNNFISCLNTGANLVGSNEKFHFIYAMHHASPSSMGTSSIDKHQSLTRDDVSQLANGNYYQIFMSSGCEPADFSEDCIAERYLNNPNGGGVAFIGNSDQGSSGDAYQCRDFFKALHKTVANLNVKTYDIGSVFQYVLSNAGSTNRRLHLLGDPEMQVWTNTPDTLIVTGVPVAVLLGDQSVNANITNLPAGEKGMICVQKDTEIYSTLTVIGSGTYSIPITVNTTGAISLTVTAHNFLPSEKTINADSTTAPNLFISDVDFGDGIVQGSGIGDGNGKNDAGETIALSLGVKNTGINTAYSVNAIVSCNSSYVNILNNQASFGTIASGNVSIGQFLYRIDSLAPEKRSNDTIPVQFYLAIRDVNNVLWKDTFNIDIFNSEIKQGNKSIVYISNNHATIAANDTVRFKIDLKNIGNAQATGIKATLTGNSSSVYLCSSVPRSYSPIGRFEVKKDTVPFEFVVSSGYSSGYENLLKFKLSVENEYGKVWNFDFDLKNPQIPTALDFTADTTEIQVTWNCSDTYSGFNVYRCNVDQETNQPLDDYMKINQDSVTYRYFNDKGLGILTKYRYKVSAISKSGKEGLLSDDILSWTSISKKCIINDFGSARGGVNLADINSDGYKEIFCSAYYAGINGVTNGYVIGLDHNGNELYNIDGNVTTMGGYAKTPRDIYATPAVGDLQANGIPCLIAVNRNYPPFELNAFANTNNNVSWEPDRLFTNSIPSGSFRGSILSNIDRSLDGSLEIITSCETGLGGPITIHAANGSLIKTLTSDGTFNLGAIAVANLDNSGGNEIIKAIGNDVYIWKSDGTPYKGTDAKYFSISNGYSFTNSSVAVCNIDNVGNKEIIVIATSGSNAIVYALNTDLNYSAGNISGWNQPIIISNGNPSIGDINHDGKLEIVTLGTNAVTVLSNTGNVLSSTDDIPYLDPYVNFSVLADVDGDSDNEIIFGSVNGNNKNIYALNPDLTKALGYPFKIPSNVTMYSTPAVADIDNDGKNELVLAVGNYILICHTNGKAGNVEWGCERYDQFNTGEYQNVCTLLNISVNETWTSTHDLCSDLNITSGNTLTISNSNLTMGNSTTITVQSGASLVIDSGHILNANVRALAGSNITIRNNGSITLRSNAEFYTETGTIVDMQHGSIDK